MADKRIFRKIIESGMYSEFLKLSIYLRRKKGYSIYNAALIFIQRPHAVYIETETQWLNKYGRFIKPDASPIIILQPFGPVEIVYDSWDTYGCELPSYMKKSFILPELQPIDARVFGRLKYIVEKLGVYYGEKELGSSCGGTAEYMDKPIGILPDYKKGKFKTHYVITINKSMSEAQKAVALLHEMGHILCGHVGVDTQNKYTKAPKRKDLSQDTKECEAEKVCEIVCASLGVESNSENYLNHYCDRDISLDTVIVAADRILKEFEI